MDVWWISVPIGTTRCSVEGRTPCVYERMLNSDCQSWRPGTLPPSCRAVVLSCCRAAHQASPREARIAHDGLRSRRPSTHGRGGGLVLDRPNGRPSAKLARACVDVEQPRRNTQAHHSLARGRPAFLLDPGHQWLYSPAIKDDSDKGCQMANGTSGVAGVPQPFSDGDVLEAHFRLEAATEGAEPARKLFLRTYTLANAQSRTLNRPVF